MAQSAANHQQQAPPCSQIPASSDRMRHPSSIPYVKIEQPPDMPLSQTHPATNSVATPEQADLLQVMQDVTGRFITNAISQLKRRAASLYLQELQEYKRSKILNVLSLPQEHCQQQGRPASASHGKPSVAHEQASNMVPVQEHLRPAAPVLAEQVYDRQLGASDEATAPFAEHQAQHSDAGGTSRTEAVQDGNLVSSAEPRLPMHVDQMANVPLLTDKAASQDAQRVTTVPPQSLQAPLLPNKSQWMPTPHAQPLPAWPHGPAQHATGNAVPQWPAQQTTFDVSQANLGFGSALSFGKQPCAVMW